MSEKLGQQLIIDNKPGADTIVATSKEQPADGYTILAQTVGFSTLPYIRTDPGYTLKDFTGIGMMSRSSSAMDTAGSRARRRSLRNPSCVLTDWTYRPCPGQWSRHARLGSWPCAHVLRRLYQQGVLHEERQADL